LFIIIFLSVLQGKTSPVILIMWPQCMFWHQKE
jgi:hypothetical protein